MPQKLTDRTSMWSVKMPNPMSLDFTPDWKKLYTAEQANEDLQDFKFEGPGWYLIKEDTLLVVPVDTSTKSLPWKREWPKDQLFLFMVWNGSNPRDALNSVINAPVRQSEV